MAPGVLRQSVIRSRATANMDLNTGITHTIVSLMSDFLVEGTRRIAVSKDGVTFLDETTQGMWCRPIVVRSKTSS